MHCWKSRSYAVIEFSGLFYFIITISVISKQMNNALLEESIVCRYRILIRGKEVLSSTRSSQCQAASLEIGRITKIPYICRIHEFVVLEIETVEEELRAS